MRKYLIYHRAKFFGLILLKMVWAALFVGFSIMLQIFVNEMTAPGATVPGFLKTVGWAIGYVAVVILLMLVKDRLSAAYINRAVMNLRDSMSAKLLESKYEDFVGNDSAKYLSHLTNDVKTISINYFNSVIAVVQLGGSMYSPIMTVAAKAALIKGVGELNNTILRIVEVRTETAVREVGFESGISISGLRYRYPGEENEILKGVDAEFERGKKYLIVGKSGSGKSTLLKLIGKMYNGFEGTIAMDGADYREITEDQLYARMAVAQQKSYLFDRTIRDNIDFKRTGDEEKLLAAIRNAELESFVAAQTNGLSEIINEEVNQISGGEKQRIGLARALCRDREILLLDEITSSLDKDTAFAVEENILGLEGKTILNVSHKLHVELLGRYDKVLILEDGRVSRFLPPDAKTAEFGKFISVSD